MAPGIAGRTRFRRWSSLAWALAGAACLALALRTVDLHGVGEALARAHWGWLGLAALSSLANNLAKVSRWQALLGEPKASWIKLARALFAAQLMNAALPVRVGEISRVAQVGQAQGAPAERYPAIAGSVVLEKLADLGAFLALTLAALAVLNTQAWLNETAWSLAGLAGVSIAILAGLVAGRTSALRIAEAGLGRLPSRLAERLAPWLASVAAALETAADRRIWAAGLAWTVLVWLTAVLTNLLVAQAVDLPMHPGQAVLLLIALQAGISLVQSPGRLGIFEMAGVWVLTGFGFAAGTSLGYTLLLHGVVYLPVLALGGWSMLRFP